MVGLRQKQDELQQIMDKLGGMEKSLQKNTHKKERLEVEVEQCSLKLGRAEQLIVGRAEKLKGTLACLGMSRLYFVMPAPAFLRARRASRKLCLTVQIAMPGSVADRAHDVLQIQAPWPPM
eukprot:1158917-Pelagomonas_calceolata.AAC.9